MKIALSSWNSRISPVFDVSQRVVIIELNGDDQVVARHEEALWERDAPGRVARLVSLGIDTLICGAVSRALGDLIDAYGIRVIPFIAGNVDEVFAAHLNGGLPNPDMVMPGCQRRRCRMRGQSHRPGRNGS